MKDEFNRHWLEMVPSITEDDTIVLAVSGGVDSMVLLDLMVNHPTIKKDQLVVAHFNHRLREASAEEAEGVVSFCRKNNLNYQFGEWQNQQVTTNIEKKAREARYQFLREVCSKQGAKYLLTAHHQDDLGETVLMKLVTGSRFENLVGIRPMSEQNSLILMRPLLSFPKEDIVQYALNRHLPYWEDDSNLDLSFKRNRFRHQMMPLIKEENPQVLNQLDQFIKQINYAADIISLHTEKYLQAVQEVRNGWRFSLETFTDVSEGEKYFFLDAFFQKYLIPLGVPVNQKQHQMVLELMLSDKSAGQIDLAEGWQVVKSYQWVTLGQKAAELTEMAPVILSEDGEVALQTGVLAVKRLVDNQRSSDNAAAGFNLYLSENQLPLTVRQPMSGDALVFNQQGQHKKVNRLFIDKKIPREIRGNYLVLEDNNKQILSLFSPEESYLSITEETDRIHYRLTYLPNK